MGSEGNRGLDRFIVGTGRCGSTLLSRMIRMNEEVASISEYLNGLDGGRRFSREPLSGPEFTEMICAVHPFLARVLERGYLVPEVTYPYDAAGARFPRGQGLPWILGTMLPELSKHPDALYEELRAFTRALPARPAPEQHRALFEWLTDRIGRTVWVERSGAAIDYLGDLDAAFPGARFLHIHRAGEEAALSMREHHAFRLAIMLVYRLPPGTGRSPEALEAFARAEDETDEIGRLLEARPPAEYFGRFWTDQVLRGFRALKQLHPDRYREVRFEDLLARPEEVLEEVAAFLAIPDPAGPWRLDAAELVRAAPASRLDGLPEAERERLQEVCRPGNVLLGRA
jgi:hypothetical protein